MVNKTVRTKFRLDSVTQTSSDSSDTGKFFFYGFRAVNGKAATENEVFGTATPNGTFTFTAIKNLDLEVGKSYFVDISAEG